VAIRKDTWRGSQQRVMIHFNPNVTACIRWEVFSNDLAFSTYPVRRAMTAPALTLLGNAFEANFCLRKVPKDVWRPRIYGLKNLHRLSGFLASGFRSVLPMSQADSDLSLDDLPRYSWRLSFASCLFGKKGTNPKTKPNYRENSVDPGNPPVSPHESVSTL
jgi:hypothetical protein